MGIERNEGGREAEASMYVCMYLSLDPLFDYLVQPLFYHSSNVLIRPKCHQQLEFTWFFYLISLSNLIGNSLSFLTCFTIFILDVLLLNIMISSLCLIISLSEVLSCLFLGPVVFAEFCWLFPCMLTSSLLWTACWGLRQEWVPSKRIFYLLLPSYWSTARL